MPLFAALLAALVAPAADAPRAADPRLEVVLFAQAPDIVHPIACDFDRRGRLLIVESHTHFPPPNYKGPKHDRLRVLEDTDGDGRADRFSTFFEGTQKTMDVAVHADGSVYLATRNEILRLRDIDNDGKADESQRIVFLDTKGDYPHNGLSGLCFDSKGDLFFGMGENLGAAYKLIGSDGKTLAGEGEGGNVFWCRADGKGLRRVATGFWNPFGLGRDIFDRLFAVDNDPDAMPPCRMLHIVDGGDFGYQFRYGRSGRHPFQAWDGQLPGTLPQVAGTGEAPCEIVSYESDGLPREYRGDLLVTAWADHRIERYAVAPRGASFVAQRKLFVQGGDDFRPSGLAVAPDGSLFVADWVLKDYTLHGKGAVWQVRSRDRTTPARPREPREGLRSAHRPLREDAARRLAADAAGRDVLRSHLGNVDVRVRAAALTALSDAAEPATTLRAVAEKEGEPGLAALAVRGLVARGADVARFLDPTRPAEVRASAVAGINDTSALLTLLTDADPFLRHAATMRLAQSPALLSSLDAKKTSDVRQRLGLLLAHRASGRPEGKGHVAAFLADADEEVRFLAVKWVADEALTEHRDVVAEALKDTALSVRLTTAYTTALARIDGQDVSEARMAETFAARVVGSAPAAVRAQALRLVPMSHPKLTPDLLGRLLGDGDATLRREAVRALVDHASPARFQHLKKVAEGADETLAALAIAGLAERAQDEIGPLLNLAKSDSTTLRREALRSLVGVKMTDKQRALVAEAGQRDADLAARVLGRPFAEGRPPKTDLDAWLKRLDGPADAAAGERVFVHAKLGTCTRCHRVDGRGQDVGPDLSTIGRGERRRLVESLLQPSRAVAPQYQTWQVETKNGKVRSGMLTRTYLDETTYVDPQGLSFKVLTNDIVALRPLPTSVMPDGLVDLMTDQELRDLFAYLEQRR